MGYDATIVSADLVIQRNGKILLGKVSSKRPGGKYFGFGNHYIAIVMLVEAQDEPKVKNSDWIEWRWFHKTGLPKKLFPA